MRTKELFGLIKEPLEMAEFYFFVAMRKGWVSGAEPMHESPDLKKFYFSDGPWEVRDVYHSGRKSYGTTTISYAATPVWVMQYQGWYDEDVTPFLKEVLAEQYRADTWHGGRGPRLIHKGSLSYFNKLDSENSFQEFSGTEEIYCTQEPALKGWHRYSGLWLLED